MKTKLHIRRADITPIARHSTKIVYLRALQRAAGFVLAISLLAGSDAREVYVDGQNGLAGSLGTAWDDACTTISRAVSLAIPGDSILVALGVYEENLQLTDGLTLLGGYYPGNGTSGSSAPRDPDAYPTIIDTTTILGDCVVAAKGSEMDGFVFRCGQSGPPWSVAAVRVPAGAEMLLSSSRIENATYYAVYVDSGFIRVDRCVFTNVGYGIYLSGNQPGASAESLSILGASSGIVEVSAVPGQFDLTNCTIRSCSFDGIFNSSAAMTVRNTIIADCLRYGVNVHTNTPVLENNDIFGNAAADYSGMAAATGIAGNISMDPLLDQDAQLMQGSPCIDAGMTLGGTHVDVDGTPRPFGQGFDIGADEFSRVLIEPELVSVAVDGQIAVAGTTHTAFVTVRNVDPVESILVDLVDLIFTVNGTIVAPFQVATTSGNSYVIQPGGTAIIIVAVSVSGTAPSMLVLIDARIHGQSLWSGTTYNVQGAGATAIWQVFGCTAGICGDCNQDGRVDVIDSWSAARISVGIDASPVPGTPAFDSCNVAGYSTPSAAATIDALDALALAQNAAGSMSISCCH